MPPWEHQCHIMWTHAWDRIKYTDRQSKRMNIILPSLLSFWLSEEQEIFFQLVAPSLKHQWSILFICQDWHSNLLYLTAPKQRGKSHGYTAQWWEKATTQQSLTTDQPKTQHSGKQGSKNKALGKYFWRQSYLSNKNKVFTRYLADKILSYQLRFVP